MVDGIKVGESVGVDGVITQVQGRKPGYGETGGKFPSEKFISSQDFQNADMVVIRSKPLSEDRGEQTVFQCYGIYSNNIITSTVNKSEIVKGTNKIQVWSYKKPYILNGDLINN